MSRSVRSIFFILTVSFLLTCGVHAVSNPICRIDTAGKKIALTFDDGPHREYTAQILDILREYGVKATFFVIGENAEKYPDLVKREFDEGHEVECHTYSHEFIDRIGTEDARNELLLSEDAISAVSSYKFNFVRPPGGIYTESFKKLADEMSYDIVLWSVDTEDWKSPAPQRIISTVMSNVKGGDIILMHDYVVGSSSTPEALRQIIPELIDSGYEFVTVSELVSYCNTVE